MRAILILIPTLAATGAAAHPGHLAEAAGHNHWVAGVAIGLAVAAGIWGAIKGRKETEARETEETGSADAEA